jgi:hypothetical protein
MMKLEQVTTLRELTAAELDSVTGGLPLQQIVSGIASEISVMYGDDPGVWMDERRDAVALCEERKSGTDGA